MSAAHTLPFDFVEYLCEARHIERGAALKLLAEEVQSLSAPAAAATADGADGDPRGAELQGTR